MATSDRWVSVAPFGKPVVPDVKRMTPGRSSSSSIPHRRCPVALAVVGPRSEGVGDLRQCQHRLSLGQPRGAPIVGHHDRGCGHLARVGDLVRRPPAVARDDDRADLEHGEERGRPLGRVGCEQRHPVAGADATRLELRREPPHRPLVFSERHATIALDDEIAIGPAPALAQDGADGAHPLLVQEGRVRPARSP